MSSAVQSEPTVTVLIYSHDAQVRERMRLAIGRRPGADLPLVKAVEVATGEVAVRTVEAGGIDLCILDGEAWPVGGMGICRQLKDEVYDAPPVLLVTGRRDDAWLANWSRAEAVISHPIDAVALADAAADLLRARTGLVAGS